MENGGDPRGRGARGASSLPGLGNLREYAEADVLCGRGGGTTNHAGNVRWRALVAANKRLYLSLPKLEKVRVAFSVVKVIRRRGGRFLRRDDETNLWNDIGDEKATEKTSQALREGQAEIRAEVGAEMSSDHGDGALGGRRDFCEYFLKNSNTSAGGGVPRPGQILPNGLITLDYYGGMIPAVRYAKGALPDRTTDVGKKPPKFAPTLAQDGMVMVNPMDQQVMAQWMIQALSPQPIYPMMQAFQQFEEGEARKPVNPEGERKGRVVASDATTDRKRTAVAESDAAAAAPAAKRKKSPGKPTEKIRDGIIIEDGKVYNCNQWHEV